MTTKSNWYKFSSQEFNIGNGLVESKPEIRQSIPVDGALYQIGSAHAVFGERFLLKKKKFWNRENAITPNNQSDVSTAIGRHWITEQF